jgi:hypothetical protein
MQLYLLPVKGKVLETRLSREWPWQLKWSL